MTTPREDAIAARYRRIEEAARQVMASHRQGYWRADEMDALDAALAAEAETPGHVPPVTFDEAQRYGREAAAADLAMLPDDWDEMTEGEKRSAYLDLARALGAEAETPSDWECCDDRACHHFIYRETERLAAIGAEAETPEPTADLRAAAQDALDCMEEAWPDRPATQRLRAALGAEAETPDGWRWECPSCDQMVHPMGMCETCGVFGVMRATETPYDGLVQRAHVPCCWCGDHHEEGR